MRGNPEVIDYLSGIGQKVFIAELMPRFPVYVDLLPKDAQEVIGKMHPHTLPKKSKLGFSFSPCG